MREIKFRAWKIADGHEMFDDIAFIDWNKSIVGVNYPISSTNTRLDKEPLDNVVLEQYTGLKDKNGVDIYEGDIVEPVEEDVDFEDEYYQIVYNETGDYPAFDLKGWTGEVNGISELSLTCGIKVVGNIHKNQELLDDTDRISPDDIGNDIHEFLHGGDK